MKRPALDYLRGRSILVSSNLGPNLTRGKLLPIVEVPGVREVVVVQGVPGPVVRHVRYVTFSRFAAATTRLGRCVHVLQRVWLLAIQFVRTRPSMVMGIYMMPHGLLAYALGRMTGRPVCIHVIGGPREIIDGGYWLDQWQVRRPSRRMESLYLSILRRADAVMVVGTETKRYLVDHGVSADRVHVMSSKIDPRRFRPIPTRRDFDLILSAQLIARKRVDLFLQIVADLKTRYPRIRAAILGTGPLRGELEDLAIRLGLADHVEFLGFHEDTEHYYNRAKVFVLTSSAEGLSLAMLEAMACGLPVVVPAVGDLGDVVQNGVTGYLIEDDDRGSFVSAIGKLLDDEKLRLTIGDTTRSTILHGYTVEDGARLWREVFHNVIPGFDAGCGPTDAHASPAFQPPLIASIPHGRADSQRATATHH
jgi:glycosyltransferase involved in cell wall biosynthesis